MSLYSNLSISLNDIWSQLQSLTRIWHPSLSMIGCQLGISTFKFRFNLSNFLHNLIDENDLIKNENIMVVLLLCRLPMGPLKGIDQIRFRNGLLFTSPQHSPKNEHKYWKKNINNHHANLTCYRLERRTTN